MPLASGELLAVTGMMGSGKTSTARVLGKLLARPVVHLDDELARRAGKAIPAIFAEDGEPAFRAMERAAVAALVAGPRDCVADLGGGAFCDPESAERLLAAGKVVFLDISADEAQRRIGRGKGAQGRPLAARWAELREARLPLYRRAHVTIAVDGLSPEAVARRIIEMLQEIL